MAEPIRPAGRVALTLAALASTIVGWLAMAANDATNAVVPSIEAPPLLPSRTLDPPEARAPVAPRRRPAPVAITRSSR